MWNAGLDEGQAGIKIARRDINNLRYIDDTTLMAESEDELKSLLMKVKEESEKVGLKLILRIPWISRGWSPAPYHGSRAMTYIQAKGKSQARVAKKGTSDAVL